MEIEFKKFTITNDKRQFILTYNGDKRAKNYYYSNLYSLLIELPNKVLLKSESKKLGELIQELQELKRFIDFNFNK